MGELDLRYGALDFVVDRYDRWWFLEVNPNGQWLWLEQATGQPMSAAVAGALCRDDRSGLAVRVDREDRMSVAVGRGRTR